MLLRDLVLVARLREADSRLVQLLPWQSTLLEQVLPAAIYLFFRFKRLFGGLHIKFRLLDFFRKTRCGCGCVGCLRLFVSALVLFGGRGQITVLQHGEQLPLVYFGPAFHVESSYWRADLGSDCRLLQWEENRFRSYGALDCGFINRSDLHRHNGFFVR